MTELRWDGKYDAHGKKTAPVRIALPFQNIETVNESAEDRKRVLDMFASGKDSEWRNRLIWGDKKYVLPSLLPEFAGKVNLIYIDPPFDTGADFSFTAQIPDNPNTDEDESTSFTKQPSLIEQKAYRDTWGRGLDSYLQWFYETALLLRDLLAEDGSIYVHLDWHVSHYAKTILDEVFGINNFRNEITWKRKGGSANPSNRLGVVTDSIFWYTKSEQINFNQQYTLESDEVKNYIEERFNNYDPDKRRWMKSPIVSPNPRPNLTYKYKGYTPPKNGWSISIEIMERWDKENKLYFPKKGTGDRIYRKIYLDEYLGQPIQSLWTDIFVINPVANERLNYNTQKPEALLERIIKTSSNEGDLVLDSFCGSGTTAAVAEKLGRRWITCDLGRFAIHTARKRLLGIEGVKPFNVQNLGKYERQQWAQAELGTPLPVLRERGRGEGEGAGKPSPQPSPLSTRERESERAAAEQTYRNFILDLYHGTPLSGYTWLHGAKAGRMIHVGAVDSPVAIGDIKSIVQELWKKVGKTKDITTSGVDVLGWEFAFDINETAKQIAAEHNIDLKTKRIPREVLEKKAVEQGDIKFYELAFLNVKTKVAKKKLSLELKDFIVPPDEIPQDVLTHITHWSQWIDYWAVDWDYKGDTFHNQWQSYRTKKDQSLDLKVEHDYENAGKYSVVVKVIDILGNDTTKEITIAM